MPRLNKSERLGRVAQTLKPEEPPFWVGFPQPPATPAQGWYWVADGDEHPTFIGADATTAEIHLLTLRGQLRPA